MLSSDAVKQAALHAGFDACGIVRAEALTDSEYPLRLWLARGWNGDLDYMGRNVEKRMDPRHLLPGARSVICVVSAYQPPDPSRHDGVAAYAQHREYHTELKQMLFAMRQELGIDAKACVDTVPISDKHWAARAGLGWIGRHTLLITTRWGSWVNLGELVTTMECDHYDTPLPSRCHDCQLCVKACPNGAIATEGAPMIDARRCTAYYTTHHPRPLPPDIDSRGYTLGCDICQLACPYNSRVS